MNDEVVPKFSAFSQMPICVTSVQECNPEFRLRHVGTGARNDATCHGYIPGVAIQLVKQNTFLYCLLQLKMFYMPKFPFRGQGHKKKEQLSLLPFLKYSNSISINTYFFGINTVSITYVTPLLEITSAIVMFATPPFASVTVHLPSL